MEFKGTTKLAYYKENAEEDYIKTPISVLRYISELESHIEKSCAPEMLDMLEKVCKKLNGNGFPMLQTEIEKLIKKATEV